MIYKPVRSNSVSTSNMRQRKLLPIVVILLAVLFVSPVRGQGDKWNKLMADGNSQVEQGQTIEAEKTYRAALVIAEKFGNKDARLAGTLIKLASVCEAQAKHDEANSLANRSLLVLNTATNSFKDLKPDSSSEKEYYKIETTVLILDSAAGIYSAQKKYDEAEPLLKHVVTIREAVARKRKTKSNDDFLSFMVQAMTNTPKKLIRAYENLATFYFLQGKHAEAEAIYTHAFKYFAESSEGMGTGQTTEASIHNKLGELYVKESKYAGAESSFVAALKIYQTGGYKHGSEIGIALSNLATLYVRQEKNYDQARSYFDQALRLLEEDSGNDQRETADALENYAILLRRLGSEAEAVEMANRAKVIRGQRTQPIQNQ